ncbi:MAG: radical SAM/SPASM domain-containing protein [Planctomycetota bacterium]
MRLNPFARNVSRLEALNDIAFGFAAPGPLPLRSHLGRTARGAKALFKRAIFAMLPRRALGALVCWKLPRSAQLEVTTRCNLHCPLCVTHDVLRDDGRIDLAGVQSLIAGCGSRLKIVNLHLLGEPLLHPDLFHFVRAFSDAGVRTTFSTNGMLLHRHLDEIFTSGLSHLSVALDGATGEDYARYRIGGDFDTVVTNLRALLAEKRRRGASLPVVQVQMVMFSYNEDREREARVFLASLGTDAVSLKRPAYESDPSPTRDAFLAQVDHGNLARRWARPVHDPDKLYRNQRLCPQLERATVLSDGRLVACCIDASGDTAYARLGEGSFRQAWRGPAHRRLLEEFRQGTLAPCGRCTLGYRDLDAEPEPLGNAVAGFRM